LATVTVRPLSRNRSYRILWTSMVLSELASETTFIAFPLLLLAHAGTAVQVGAVVSVLAAARMIGNIPAGALADRCDRKRLMLAAQGVRAVAIASILPPLLLGGFTIGHLVLIAAVEGCCSAVFQPAEHAALPQVVPGSQLADAVARNSARPFAALLLGPALAGVAFGVQQALPFFLDAAMLSVSFAALTRLRLPRRETSTKDATQPSRPVVGGFALVFRRPVIRSTVLWMSAVNLVFHALVVVTLVVAGENDVRPGAIGLMMACFGAGGLAGALVAGKLHAALSASVLVIGSSWLFAVMALLLAVAGHGLIAGVLLGVAAMAMPVAITTVQTYQLTSTADEHRGRLSGVVGLCTDLAATAAPVLGTGLLAGTGSATTTALVCAGVLAVIAIGTHASKMAHKILLPHNASHATEAS
jgi:MFS family permease